MRGLNEHNLKVCWRPLFGQKLKAIALHEQTADNRASVYKNQRRLSSIATLVFIVSSKMRRSSSRKKALCASRAVERTYNRQTQSVAYLYIVDSRYYIAHEPWTWHYFNLHITPDDRKIHFPMCKAVSRGSYKVAQYFGDDRQYPSRSVNSSSSLAHVFDSGIVMHFPSVYSVDVRKKRIGETYLYFTPCSFPMEVRRFEKAQ
jgi:hypothetical protein